VLFKVRAGYAQWCVTSAEGDLRRRGDRFDVSRMVAGSTGGIATADMTASTYCHLDMAALRDVELRALADQKIELVANLAEVGQLTFELVPETERTIDWKSQARQLMVRD
jgi:hypothetical protein